MVFMQYKLPNYGVPGGTGIAANTEAIPRGIYII